MSNRCTPHEQLSVPLINTQVPYEQGMKPLMCGPLENILYPNGAASCSRWLRLSVAPEMLKLAAVHRKLWSTYLSYASREVLCT